METFQEISPERAWQMMNEDNAILVDIRDELLFTYSHAKGAFHLTNQTYGQFQDKVDFEQPIIVSCYHGVSSRNVAQFLVEQGYEQVYSLMGGFERWQKSDLPVENGF